MDGFGKIYGSFCCSLHNVPFLECLTATEMGFQCIWGVYAIWILLGRIYVKDKLQPGAFEYVMPGGLPGMDPVKSCCVRDFSAFD